MLGSLHDDRPDNNDSSEVGAGAGVGAPGRALAAPPSPRGIVLACADLLHRGDLPAARRTADAVLAAASPLGDATDRLAHQFARSLALRIDSDKRTDPGAAAVSAVAYLAFNQIVPFLRFSHLTANQAILEAVDGARRVHVIDLDAAYGVQWPPLLQAIADRADPALGPPEVRITGAGADREVLLRTGDRLHAFASSLHLPFRFHPLLLSCTAQIATTSVTNLELHPDEALAVNCVLFLHKLRGDDELAAFLKWVKGMHPAVVTIAEREGSDASNHHTDDLPRRVAVAMEYYAPVFDALEATVPPGNRDRLAVEQEVLGREIDEAVAAGPHPWWRGLERCGAAACVAGLAPRPLSAFAVSQARLLLRLHYPSEGYVVQEARGACFLGWQTRPLMSVSSWQ